MKTPLLITLTLLVLIGGPTLYFLSSPERQVTETFSTFGFRNDAVERPATEGEEEWYSDDLGDPEDVTEYEDEWYGGGSDGDEPSNSSSGGSSTDGGGSAPSTGGTPGNTTDPSLAYTPSQTTPSTGTSDTDTSITATTPAVPPTYTLTVTSPTTGSTLNNAGPADIAKVLWSYGDLTAKITIELHNASGLVRTLATKTGNSGRYAWAHAPTLQDGQYKLRLTAYSSTGVLRTTAETGYFEVSKTKEEDVHDSTPTIPQDRDVYGNIIPSPTGPKEMLGCEYVGAPRTPGSGPGPCGSYQVPIGTFSSGMTGENAITKVWQYNLEYNLGAINSLRFGMEPSHGITFRFTTPTDDSAPEDFFPHYGSVSVLEHVSRGVAPAVHVTLSEQRGYFNYALLGGATYNGCHTTSNATAGFINYKLRKEGDAPENQYECTLRPGKTYYINIRFERADEYGRGNIQCNPTTLPTCGVVFQVN